MPDLPITPDDDAIAARIRAAAASVEAPAALRHRIDAQRDSAARRRRVPLRAVAALGVALVAIALVASLADRGPGGPSLAEATAVALRAPASALPPSAQDGATLRGPAVDGVTFPNYAYSAIDLRAVGQRRERSRGRDVVAVSYEGQGDRIGYAIVAAPTIKVPTGSRTVTYRGMRFAVLRSGGAAVVTWHRSGRTCILASRTASPRRLLRVAAWTQ